MRRADTLPVKAAVPFFRGTAARNDPSPANCAVIGSDVPSYSTVRMVIVPPETIAEAGLLPHHSPVPPAIEFAPSN